MTDLRVTCITKDDRFNPYERIVELGGPGWRASQSQVINSIKAGANRFYVERPAGDRVWLVVRISPYGNEYVKTEADGDMPNNLLQLSRCT